MTAQIEIRPATTSDISVAEAWLSQAGLPTADLTPEHMRRFLVAAVDAAAGRGRGVGTQLVTALEQLAAVNGIDELWLLTIDADNYFTALGYERRQRIEAPEPIQGTQEFSVLCPGDAVLMSKFL